MLSFTDVDPTIVLRRCALALPYRTGRTREAAPPPLPQRPNHRVSPPSMPTVAAHRATIGTSKASTAGCFSH
jgi:hypothetical protein